MQGCPPSRLFVAYSDLHYFSLLVIGPIERHHWFRVQEEGGNPQSQRRAVSRFINLQFGHFITYPLLRFHIPQHLR